MSIDRLTIILPWLDSRLLPNNRNGKVWGATNGARKAARRDGELAAKAALGRHTLAEAETYPLVITFVAPNGNHGDLDNMLAAIKAALDGVADGLGVNDKRFRPISIDVMKDDKKQGFIKVEIGR